MISELDRAMYLMHSRSRDYGRRVTEAKNELKRAASIGRPVVALSWGKDSTVLGHLALDVFGGIDVMHMRVAHELPGGEHVEAYFRERCTVHELPPINTIAESVEWLRKVGLPHERTKSAHQKIIKTRKKSRADMWATDNGYQVTVLGMRAQESIGRRTCFRVRGLTYQLSTGHWMSNPIGWWSASDVWAYHVAHGLPYHRLYDCEWAGRTREWLRSTGWLYTDGADRGHISWLRRHFPEQYRLLVEAFPRVASLS